MPKIERIDRFILDRLVRKFGQDIYEAGLEGKKSLWGLFSRDYSTEELDDMISHTVEAICNYFDNKAKNPNVIDTTKPKGEIMSKCQHEYQIVTITRTIGLMQVYAICKKCLITKEIKI